MGKDTIELTLKQLIDLGIINIKKSKRKKKHKQYKKLLQKSKDEVFSPYKTPSGHMAGYSTPYHLPYLQQNTDVLRVRDDNQNLNTRLLEYKNQLENTKQEAEDFRNRSKSAFHYLLNSIANPSSSIGYSDDDAVGAFGATEGSSSFRVQVNNAPDTVVRLDDGGPTIEEYETPLPPPPPQPKFTDIDEEETIIKSPIRDKPKSEVTKSEEPKKKSLFKSVGKGITKGFQALTSSATKIHQTDLPLPKGYDERNPDLELDEDQVYNMYDNVFDAGLDDTFGSPPHQVQDEPTIVSRQGFNIPQVVLKESGIPPYQKAGGGTPNQPPKQPEEISSGDYQHINTTKRKPTKEEIREWKDWYENLAGDDVNPTILASNKKSVIEPAIVKILLKEYKSTSGGDKITVLKSKDSKFISRELEKLRRLNKILA
jgi:hypothetical protein